MFDPICYKPKSWHCEVEFLSFLFFSFLFNPDVFTSTVVLPSPVNPEAFTEMNHLCNVTVSAQLSQWE